MKGYRAHRFRSADGRLELFARDYPEALGDGPVGPRSGAGAREGIPLLLMHGLTRNSADFEPLVPHLAGRYRLVVPDQRGRGLSQYDPQAGNYDVDVYVRDMFALMDGLGIGRFGIVGTSMGGLIGMTMAAEAPGRVAALVLNDVGPEIEERGLERIRGYVGPCEPARDWAEAAGRIATVNAVAFPGFAQADWLAFARRTCRETDAGIVAAYDPAITAGIPDNLWQLWDKVSALPVLVIRGAISDLLSQAAVAAMRRRHAGHFGAIDVRDRGHAPLLDEPKALAALLPFLHEHAR